MANRTSYAEMKKSVSSMSSPIVPSVIQSISRIVVNHKKKIAVGAVGLTIIIIAIVVVRQSIVTRAQTDGKSTPVSFQIDVKKSFDVSGIDNKGFRKGKLSMTIASAEKTSDVLVNNQTFQAKNGKLFLLINLEYTNDSTQSLNIIPDNLIRLVYNGDANKKFSADLHNNTVVVAPISTKTDRVGYVIPHDAKDIKLLIGELDGKKEEVAITF